MDKFLLNKIKNWCKDYEEFSDRNEPDTDTMEGEAYSIFQNLLSESKREIPKLNSLYEKVELYGQPTWIVSTIAKEDLMDYFTEKEIKELTDEEMNRIADKMGNAITETSYWDCLSGVADYMKEQKILK